MQKDLKEIKDLKEVKNLKEVNRDVKLEVLASGYTPFKRRMEILTLTIFFLTWGGTGYNLFSQFDTQAGHLQISALGWFIAMFLGDFIGGVVHWACDTWGTPESKPFGVFIRSFREHHIHPKAMTTHDFIEVSADSCVLAIPVLILTALWRVKEAFVIELLILHIAFWTCLFVLFTNQVHKWAHMDRSNRPFIVSVLQSTYLILSYVFLNSNSSDYYELSLRVSLLRFIFISCYDDHRQITF